LPNGLRSAPPRCARRCAALAQWASLGSASLRAPLRGACPLDARRFPGHDRSNTGPSIAWIRSSLAVPTSDRARLPDPGSAPTGSFILYVEGPRDRSILRAWASRLIPDRAPDVLEGAVILGGRRPARAREHFRSAAAGSRALCVLDRDEEGAASAPEPENGLEFFTWGRRHIESYLLVAVAIRRALSLPASDHRLEAALERELPHADDGAGWRALDAKRLLSDSGPIARSVGRPLPLARIARATREDELHADVHDVFERVRGGLAQVAPPRRNGHRALGDRRRAI
jgi:hypothetical protein